MRAAAQFVRTRQLAVFVSLCKDVWRAGPRHFHALHLNILARQKDNQWKGKATDRKSDIIYT